MKHDQPDRPIDAARARQVLEDCGVTVSEAQALALAAHASLVRLANESMNLTRITDPEAMIQLHIADSLAFLPHIDALEGEGVDVGSGAGYPGIPLAILGHRLTLCESQKKKAAFLVAVAEELRLPVTVRALRAEELAVVAPGSADWVIFRAVSSLPSLVELASPLLKDAGRVVCLKGPLTREELSSGVTAAKLCGMKLTAQERYLLPQGESRTVIVFERVGRPATRLPRRPGMAQRHPLA